MFAILVTKINWQMRNQMICVMNGRKGVKVFDKPVSFLLFQTVVTEQYDLGKHCRPRSDCS